MTRDEIIDLLEDLHAVYSGRMNVDKIDTILKVWSLALSDCDKDIVSQNFVKHIQHSPFPPTPADMAKDALKKKKPPQFVMDYSAGEDWPV